MTDVDSWWRAVGNAALIGTARRPVPELPELVVGLRQRAGGPREEALLDAAALGAAALRAGRRLEPADPPEAAPDDTRRAAPRRAVQLLELVLTQPPAGPAQRTGLLAHWLRAASAGGCRAPHALLPTLLDLATATRELRRPAAAVLDERGLWLAAQRDEWSWAAAAAVAAHATASSSGPTEDDLSTEAWARLPSAERLAVVTSRRAADPEAARDLVTATWESDTARDRRAHLEALRIALGPADEPLLERALDDRSATVREMAAELLDALPTSARAGRMGERLRGLVHRTGLLGRGVEVSLPGDPDASGVRDGLGRPPPRRSARGWHLEQLCAGAPLEIWRELTGADPATTVRRLVDEDALAGIRRAAVARQDGEWAMALLRRAWDPRLVPALPRQQRQTVTLARVEATRDRVHETATLLGGLDPPWSADLSVALVERLRASPVGSAIVAASMPHLVARLHPAALDALEAWLRHTDADQTLQTHLRNLLQFHSVKRAITEAFR